MPVAPHATSIDHQVRIAARPETVFGFFTDPARLIQWMGAGATLDPRPGGICRVVFHPTRDVAALLAPEQGPEPPGTNVVLGEFVEVDPYNRIVFTWGYERSYFAMPPQSTTVEVSLTPDGEDTIVQLVHRRIPAPATTFHQAGWNHYLPRLSAAASGETPGQDPLQAV